jgi:hypothetical protein
MRLRQTVREALLPTPLFVVGSFAAVWISKTFFHFSEGVTTFLIVLFNALSVLLGHKVLRFAQRTDLNTPPLNAEYLFYVFVTAENCDALIGDLEERYKLIHKKFGAPKANLWYWTQAIRSVWPIAWAWAKTVGKRLSGLAALIELYRKIRH